MSRKSFLIVKLLAFSLAGMLTHGAAWAEKPSWANEQNGKNRGGEQKEERDHPHGNDASRNQGSQGEYFKDSQRTAVRDYFNNRAKSGRCPLG